MQGCARVHPRFRPYPFRAAWASLASCPASPSLTTPQTSRSATTAFRRVAWSLQEQCGVLQYLCPLHSDLSPYATPRGLLLSVTGPAGCHAVPARHRDRIQRQPQCAYLPNASGASHRRHCHVAPFPPAAAQRVTIFGESAGAGSTSDHLVSPRSWPLFQGAIMESTGAADW